MTNKKEIDWSKAPEDATHYSEAKSHRNTAGIACIATIKITIEGEEGEGL